MAVVLEDADLKCVDVEAQALAEVLEDVWVNAVVRLVVVEVAVVLAWSAQLLLWRDHMDLAPLVLMQVEAQAADAVAVVLVVAEI